MTYREKLEKSRLSAMKKVFDNNIRLAGTETQLIRFQITEDRYGDETKTLISESKITGIFDMPGDFPINRYRADDQRTTVVSESLSFFDVLPIELFYKWTLPESEEGSKGILIQGDLLLFIMEDEDIKIPVLFRVADIVGSFSKSLVYSKALIAPYNGILETELLDVIQTYVNDYEIEDTLDN